MKKNIVYCLICTVLLMISAFPLYLQHIIQIEITAQSNNAVLVKLINTDQNINIQEKVISPFQNKIYFNILTDNLKNLKLSFVQEANPYQFLTPPRFSKRGSFNHINSYAQTFNLFFLLKKKSTLEISSLKIIGKESLPLENNEKIQHNFKKTYENLNIPAAVHFSFITAFILALSFFTGSYLIFRFKTVAVIAASAAGYFCFSFYFNHNLAEQSPLLTCFLIISFFCLYRQTYLLSSFPFNRPLFIFSICCSLLHISAYTAEHTLSFDVLPQNYLMMIIAAVSEIILFYTVFLYVFKFFDYLKFYPTQKENNYIKFYKEHIFIVSFCFILFIYLIFDLIYYPGKISPNMVNQIRQMAHKYDPTQHHPFLSTFIMWLCFKVGFVFKIQSFGLFLYILLQNIVCAGAFAASLKELDRLKLSFLFIFVSLLFFSVIPFGFFAVYGAKDVLYSGIFVFFVLQTISFPAKKTVSDAALYISTALLLSLLRNNGLYVVLPAFLFLYFSSSRKKTAITAFVCTFLLFWSCTQIIFPALGFIPGSKKEIFSIPFQQTALYVKKHDAQITLEEHQAIANVLEIQKLAALYQKALSDPVKATYKIWQDPQEIPLLKNYLFVWAKMFFKHPITYVQAFLALSDQYYTFVENPPKFPAKITYKKIIPKVRELHATEPVKKITDKFFYSYLWTVPPLYLLYSCSFYSIAFFLTVIYFFRHQNWKNSAPFIPVFFTILICIASPMNGLLRYAMPLMAAFPLCIGLAAAPALPNVGKEKKEEHD